MGSRGALDLAHLAMKQLRGVHPRLITQAPDVRASLAILPLLQDLGDDFAWAVWYAVWKAYARGDRAAVLPPGDEGTAQRFRAAARTVPELADELEILAAFAAGDNEPRAPGDALVRVAEWAAGRGLHEPAIQCAEAAAALVPESARRALAAARMNRLFGEVSRAELFYERAITLARQTRRWRTYVRAHLGKGTVKKALGDPEAARAHYFTAARAARNLSGERWLAAQTQHDLLGLAAEEGSLEQALRHARQALEWYPRHHPNLPALAHDIGFLLVRLGIYPSAIELLQTALGTPIAPQDRVIAWSTLARAGAGMGDTAIYARAVENVLRGVGLFDLHAAAAFDNLARAAAMLGLWEDARQYAERSLEIAGRRAQAEAVKNARRALTAAIAHTVPSDVLPSDERLTSELHALATNTKQRLAVWHGRTWKRKRQSGPENVGRI
ncbi:MAG TPA: tetratricopeptide repeat protein [Longimicrobium sp.]|nr:tetratricopeptide repeat protein [Longimicrobium sp.]